MQAYTLTVSKFNTIVRDIFNSEELLHNIQIVGEVFGISKSKNSVYFYLKDEECSLPCVTFYGEIAQNINEGDMVVVTGSPNFYAKSGRFNFVVNKIEPFGLGILYQRFMELKAKLEKEGLFDESHKKPIPKNIKRIGVVTSKDGAVIQDIRNVTWRRNRGVDIVLYDTKVQGNGAEKEIVEGINFFSEYDKVDVVIVARGGGSMEDLAAYNTEEVARATYACKKPIVSAVGHETDFTIIDFVSDLRAPTPSAAAELLSTNTNEAKLALKRETSRLSRLIDSLIADNTMQLNGDVFELSRRIEKLAEENQNKLSKLANKISTRLDKLTNEHTYALNLKLESLKKLNPLDILSRGYAKIEQQNKPISSADKLDLSKEFEINFADGVIVAKGEKK